MKKSVCTQKKSVLIVHGYLRKEENKKRIILPQDILDLITKWYHSTFKMIKFSDIHRSKYGLKLFDNHKCVKKLKVRSNKYILAESSRDHVFGSEIYCYRAFVNNLKKKWFVFGISPVKNDFLDSSYADCTFYGISHNMKWNPSKTVAYHSFLKKDKICVDLLINIPQKTLEICMVNDKKQRIIKLKGIPKDIIKSCVPHFNFGDSAFDAELRLAEIPSEWFGKSIEHLFG